MSQPLTDAEIDELDDFLLYADIPDGMTLDMLDGYLHALAVGPNPPDPARWLPRVWGEEHARMLPELDDPVRLARMVGLITRLYDDIVARLDDDEGPSMLPLWSSFEDGDVEREDAQIWAHGFLAGIELCEADWAPLLASEQGRRWLQPLERLDEQASLPDGPTLPPAELEQLSLQIPEAVLAMHQYWLRRASAPAGSRRH